MPGQLGNRPTGGSVRKGLRRIAAGVSAGVLVTGLTLGGVEAAGATHLVDYGSWGGIGYGAGGYSDGWGYQGGQGYSGGDQSGQGSASESSGDPATSAESRGVVLIDTQLYTGSEAAGTGIVLSSSGTVLTNYHVVEGSTTVKATIASTGKTYTATVVGADQKADVAVLQLKDASGLTTATIDNDNLGVGDDVTAVGNAGGTDTLTAADGEVTALDQQITTEAEDTVAGETLTGLIQTDANVQAGDSGGPLYDSEGEVTGIDTAASSGGTVQGYAIPIDNALTIVKQIESGHATTDVRIGAAAYLGVEVTTEDSESNGSGDGSGGWGSYDDPYGDPYGGTGQDQTSTTGATVAGVESGTPAARIGLAEGDTITRVGSTTISSADDLTSVLDTHRPGDKVNVEWTDSSGQQHSATVTLGASPVN